MRCFKLRFNKFSYLLFVFSIINIATSCNSQLDVNPTNSFSNDGFWTNETNAMLALTGVYRANLNYGGAQTAPSDWWDFYGLVMLEFVTDNAYDRRGENAPYQLITNGQLLANNTTIKAYWDNSYFRIATANNFLENIHQVSMNEDKKARLKAEVRFIRACQYFYLSQHWGNVPLITTSLTPEEANSVEKASKSEIVNFVLAELTESVEDLPEFGNLSVEESGRASKQAALAFLGRLYLSENMFSEAAKTYEVIIGLQQNIIDPDYRSIFNESNELSKEIIFSTKYTAGFGPNKIMLYSNPAKLGGFHLINPLGSLAESYQFSDGTPFSYQDSRFNPAEITEGRDPRFGYTFITNGSTVQNQLYISHPDSTNSPDRVSYSLQATRSGFGLKKFSQDDFSGLIRTDYGGDMPVIRYAEVLLSYLEAKLESGEAITQVLLDETINMVRARQSVQMPPITETNPDFLRPILRNERRVELAMEGLRFWDLLRWGIAGEVLQGDFWGAPYPGSVRYSSLSKKIDPSGVQRWYVTSRAFRTGIDEVWPIPQSESDINPKLLD